MTTKREELRRLLQLYADALATRDVDRLPVAGGVRFTENAQEIPFGEGLWATATGVHPRYVDFIDAQSGQAGFMGVVEEHGQPACLTIRLKSDGGRISELEQFVIRQRSTLFNPAGWMGPAIFRTVEPSKRSSRTELARAANLYFDGIEQDDGGIIPVHDDCKRIENGVQTVLASESDFASSTAAQGFNLFKLGVAEQISTGFFAYVPRIRDRRMQMIDEEQSMVCCVCVFDQPGAMTAVDVKGFGKVDLPSLFAAPASVLICELFQLENGKIRAISASVDFVPYGLKSGW